MATAQKKSLNAPEETRNPPKAKVEVVKFGEASVMRITYEPGWKWSDHAKPVVGTESCQVFHFGYFLSGRLHVVMNDGTELDFESGDAMVVPPGHNAWVVGDAPCVVVDFQGVHPSGK